MYKKATINISRNGLSHFLKQSHFVVTLCGGFDYLGQARKNGSFRFPLYRERTHFEKQQCWVPYQVRDDIGKYAVEMEK